MVFIELALPFAQRVSARLLHELYARSVLRPRGTRKTNTSFELTLVATG
jgi:hypothetical protein